MSLLSQNYKIEITLDYKTVLMSEAIPTLNYSNLTNLHLH